MMKLSTVAKKNEEKFRKLCIGNPSRSFHSPLNFLLGSQSKSLFKFHSLSRSNELFN